MLKSSTTRLHKVCESCKPLCLTHKQHKRTQLKSLLPHCIWMAVPLQLNKCVRKEHFTGKTFRIEFFRSEMYRGASEKNFKFLNFKFIGCLPYPPRWEVRIFSCKFPIKLYNHADTLKIIYYLGGCGNSNEIKCA